MSIIEIQCSVCNADFSTREGGGHDECPACRSSHYYWRKKRPAEIVRRRQRLGVFSTRLDLWYSKEGKSK